MLTPLLLRIYLLLADTFRVHMSYLPDCFTDAAIRGPVVCSLMLWTPHFIADAEDPHLLVDFVDLLTRHRPG